MREALNKLRDDKGTGRRGIYFLEVGYEAFSLTQLAKRADVVKGALYLYFQTKEELFLTLYEQSLNAGVRRSSPHYRVS